MSAASGSSPGDPPLPESPELPAAASVTGHPHRPLSGVRVLVGRPAGRADELLVALRAAGADAVPVPLIAIRPATDSPYLRAAVAELAAGVYDWVAFTSAAAVTAVLAAAEKLAAAPLIGGHTRVAAVGPATADAVRRAGIRVDLVPAGAGSAAALAASWPTDPAGAAVLLPRSARAADTLPDALRVRGHRVHTVTAYRTDVLPVPDPLARELATGAVRAVLLTSPSGADALAGTPLAAGTVVIAIGRPTAGAAARAGLPVTAVAARPSTAGLVEALIHAVTGAHPTSIGM